MSQRRITPRRIVPEPARTLAPVSAAPLAATTPDVVCIDTTVMRRIAAPLAVPGYDFLAVLGVGGMGTVYLARHTLMGREVAIKVVRPAEGRGRREADVARARFEIEARAMARLRHPNVIGVHEFGDVEGVPYVVQEYAPGGSLDRRSGDWPLPWEAAARVGRDIAAGLAHAHANGVVHRDLKPGNILLEADGTARVADFGLAKIAGGDRHLTRTNQPLGTLAYMAPEQAAGGSRELRPSADVWAAGVILFELLSGRHPFEAPTPLGVMTAVQSGKTPVLPWRVPDWLAAVVNRCLRKKPHERYRDGAELLAALDARRPPNRLAALLGNTVVLSAAGTLGVAGLAAAALGLPNRGTPVADPVPTPVVVPAPAPQAVPEARPPAIGVAPVRQTLAPLSVTVSQRLRAE